MFSHWQREICPKIVEAINSLPWHALHRQASADADVDADVESGNDQGKPKLQTARPAVVLETD